MAVIHLRDMIFALTEYDSSPLDVKISDAVIDSRQAGEGSLFIALPGEKVNGHDYIKAAFENGAIIALVDQALSGDFQTIDLRRDHFKPTEMSVSTPLCLRVEDALSALQTIATYWRQKHPVRTIGITGSVGKTSTKELTAALLSQKYNVLKNPGNRNNEIGLPLTLLELAPDHACAVLEMGFYVPGEIRTLCEIAKPHVGVLTNIGTVHAERAGSKEIIAQGKAELVQSLPPAPEGVAILNRDDPMVWGMAEQTIALVLSYGINHPADLTASQIESKGLAGLSCVLTYEGQTHPITSPLLGEFSVYTILRAAAVALTEELDWDLITEGIAITQDNLRMRQFTLPNGAVIIDDSYNASPESTTAALELLNGLAGRRIAILGDMLELGMYEQEGHQAVGTLASSAADVLILIGERSRTIARAAREQGFPANNIHWYSDSNQAAEKAAAMVQEGDVVLIKGSNSMRMDRIIAKLEGLS